jgi:hypothetical protein
LAVVPSAEMEVASRLPAQGLFAIPGLQSHTVVSGPIEGSGVAGAIDWEAEDAAEPAGRPEVEVEVEVAPD